VIRPENSAPARAKNQSGQRVADSGGDRRPVGLLLDAESCDGAHRKLGGLHVSAVLGVSEFDHATVSVANRFVEADLRLNQGI